LNSLNYTKNRVHAYSEGNNIEDEVRNHSMSSPQMRGTFIMLQCASMTAMNTEHADCQ